VKTYELFPDFRPNGYKTFHLELKKLQEITSKKDKSFSYLYWANPDLLEHEVGIYHESVKTELEKLNRELEDFSKTMNDDTLIIVIADHGLVDVKPIELYKDEELLKLLLRMPSIEPRATNFFVKPFKKHKFKKMFNEKYGNDYKLLSKNELLYSGLLGQGDHHPLVDSFLGDFMAIAISDKYFKFKESKLFKAHHAGLLEGEMEVPLIVYHKKNGPLKNNVANTK
jgi:predicted AlkP superfamily pyrophosphatase or phosphodiesterase